VYINELANELSKRHRVRIYAPVSNKSTLNNNIEYVNFRIFKKSNNCIMRIIQDISYGLLVWTRLKRADITHFFHIKTFVICIFNQKKGKSIVNLQFLFKGISAFFIKYADIIVANSKFLKEQFIKINNYQESRIIVVPNAVNLEKFQINTNLLREKYNIKDKTVIGFIGRIAWDKGIIYLLTAFKMLLDKYRDIVLLIVGPYKDEEFGEYAHFKELQKIIFDNKLGNDVIFTGLIAHEELPQYYHACDILCFPHIWEETFGIVAIEALACGKPVIISDSGGLAEIISDGLDGFIVKKKDAEQIASRLSQLIDDTNLRASISQKARIRAGDFSFEKIAREYENIYKTLQ